ncbi:MAG: hypothetical protein ACI4JM_02990 [Oscillospiraceae bacterium]
MAKKVSVVFYKFTFEKEKISENGKTFSTHTLSSEENISCFNDIYSKMKVLSNGHRVKKSCNNDFIVETVKFENNVLFAKIGRENPSSTVAIRDFDTLESEPVKMTQSQLLETFTYFILDFQTGILCFIYLQSAPKTAEIKDFFAQYTKENKITPQTSIILTHDVLRNICKKGFITKIDFKIAVPPDKVLSDIVGMPINDFDAVQNIKTSTLSYTLTADRNKKLFREVGAIENTCNLILEKFDVKHFKIKAKDALGLNEEVDLINSKFTKNVTFNVDNLNELEESDFQSELMNTYNDNKEEILTLIR